MRRRLFLRIGDGSIGGVTTRHCIDDFRVAGSDDQ